MSLVVDGGALGAALALGFRHGFDWDHLAALSDLTGSQRSHRRSMVLAGLYAAGHAAMIVVLGAAAIVFAARLPTSVDAVMERVAGITLIGLAIWIVWTAVTTRAAPPLRSRWMLAIGGLRRLVARRRAPEVVVVEHSHPHDHGHEHGLHTHAHAAPSASNPDGALDDGAEITQVAVAHSHTHRHVGVAVPDPFVRYDAWSALGIGMLHGVGAETPTQILLFAAAAHASATSSSLALLGCFVIGLVTANTVVASATTLGNQRMLRSRLAAGILAAVTAALSFAVGTALLLGAASSLPSIFGG